MKAGAAPKAGIWTVGETLVSFVQCQRVTESRDICVMFDEITLDPVLEEALDKASAKLNDRLLILRDPLGRALWSHGPPIPQHVDDLRPLRIDARLAHGNLDAASGAS